MLALVILGLGGAGGGSWWWWTAYHKPLKPCGKCGGEKYTPVRFSRGRFRRCDGCDGTGLTLTWAARQRLKKPGAVL